MSWGTLTVCMVLVMVISPLRALVGGMISNFLTPGLISILKQTGIWLLYLWKMFFRHHGTLLRNLMSPRKVIYRSLESDDEA